MKLLKCSDALHCSPIMFTEWHLEGFLPFCFRSLVYIIPTDCKIHGLVHIIYEWYVQPLIDLLAANVNISSLNYQKDPVALGAFLNSDFA